MNSLLFSMPGTPIIYYGDEIGMGDNVYLGDRNGVRTPMQWSSDRNAGFSRADPARLYFPVIMDPVYGYEAINVEAQERSPFSLLHWMKRMIALRRQHPVFGRGSIEFIRTDNRKVLTYVRRYENDIVLCVANLSRTVQPVRDSAGAVRRPDAGRDARPDRVPAHRRPAVLPDAGAVRLLLVPAAGGGRADHARARRRSSRSIRRLPALFAGVVWDSILDGSMRTHHRAAGARAVPRSGNAGSAARRGRSPRRGSSTGRRCGAARTRPSSPSSRREYRDGGRERYVLPLAMSSGAEADAVEQQHPAARRSPASPARERACSTTASSTMGRARRCWRRCRSGRDDRRCGTGAIRGERTVELDAASGARRRARADHAHGARSEQHLGDLRPAADHEAVPAPRAGPESRRRDRRSS